MHPIAELMDRYLPVPPDPAPEPGSDADYLWRATLFNSRQECIHRIVEMRAYQPNRPSLALTGAARICDLVEPIIRVECDRRGHGVRVFR